MAQKYSVCMSVYKNDRPMWFEAAVSSIWQQTVIPSEIILVVDGPIPDELDASVKFMQSEIPCFKVIRLEKNCGHATARQTGLEAAEYELVAIMDSDDLSLPDRFEKQLKAFEEHSGVSVVGGLIKEFVEVPDNVVGMRMVPEHDTEIKKHLKARCPMNLVTIMAKKSDVQAVGGYLELFCEEDYYLWVRLAQKGYKFYNIQENLVNVRVGKDMYARRGGWNYFKAEATLQKIMLNAKIISLPRYIYNVCGRFAIQVAMPNWLRAFVFQKLFRK